MTENNEVYVTRPELMGAVREAIAHAALEESFKSMKAQGQISLSARVKPVRAADRFLIAAAYNTAVVFDKMPAEDSDRALIADAYRYLQESAQLPIDQPDAEGNEVHVTQPELMGTVRETIKRATLAESYKSLKAQGQISWSARVKPVRAKDRAMIAQAYDSAVVREKLPAADSDRALIAEAYQYLQESGQLPLAKPDVVVCVHSSDEIHDFFAGSGLGACKDAVCEHLGIESADDLELITAQDLKSTKFTMWAQDNLTMVQHKKLITAFS